MVQQTKLFWVLTIITLLWIAIMRPYTPNNIIAFELAKTPEAAEQIILHWGKAGVQQAINSIYLDFVFILLYCASIMMGCFVASNYATMEPLQSTAIYFSIAIWVAGALDVIENIAMLKTLQHITEQTTLLAYYMATIKFTLVALCLLYVLFSALIGIMSRLKS
jgi:hypothetical protein